ncbi:hypothetical protein C8Q76DRAFT_747774 [Earliella scabrosa]|nr:hypothetical protein C8Q76DRAFT_747774 [Earliella scabrosa]
MSLQQDSARKRGAWTADWRSITARSLAEHSSGTYVNRGHVHKHDAGLGRVHGHIPPGESG